MQSYVHLNRNQCLIKFIVMRSPSLIFIVLVFIAFTTSAQVTTIVLQPDSTNGKDAILHGLASLASTNWATEPQFCAAAWTFNGTPGVVRGVVDFDLSMIPAGATLISASLSLYAWDMFNATGFGQHSPLSGSNMCWLERITSPWTETTVTWNNQPTTTQVNRVMLPASTAPTQNYTNINLTTLVNDMLANPATSHGLMLKLDDENYYRRMNFCTSDHPDSTKRPRLEITYLTSVIPDPCPSYSFHTIHICHRDSVYLQGAYRNIEGIYYDTLVNAMSSDSIVVTALYIVQPITTLQNQQICDGDSLNLYGNWEFTTGVYSQSYVSQYGCDSTSHTFLEVVKLDNSVSLAGATLTASEQGASYQWLDCDQGFAPVPGAVSQSFTPAVNGNYAVMITKNGCTVVSPCISVATLAAPGNRDAGSFMLIPNPVTDGQLTLVFNRTMTDVRIIIHTMHGREVFASREKGGEVITLDLQHLTIGMYLITVTSPEGTISQPFVIK